MNDRGLLWIVAILLVTGLAAAAFLSREFLQPARAPRQSPTEVAASARAAQEIAASIEKALAFRDYALRFTSLAVAEDGPAANVLSFETSGGIAHYVYQGDSPRLPGSYTDRPLEVILEKATRGQFVKGPAPALGADKEGWFLASGVNLDPPIRWPYILQSLRPELLRKYRLVERAGSVDGTPVRVFAAAAEDAINLSNAINSAEPMERQRASDYLVREARFEISVGKDGIFRRLDVAIVVKSRRGNELAFKMDLGFSNLGTVSPIATPSPVGEAVPRERAGLGKGGSVRFGNPRSR